MTTINSSDWTQIDYWTAQYYDTITHTNYTAQLRLVAKVTSQSVANNTSTVYFKWQKRLSEAASGRSVYNNYTYTYNVTGKGAGGENHSAAITFSPGTVSSATWTDVGSSNYWGSVTHKDDGTLTVSATVTGTRFNGVAFSTAESITFPTIARASKPTASKTTVTLDGSDSVTINTNRASSSFTHTLSFTVGGNTVSVNNVGASYTWTPGVAYWMPYMSSWQETVTVTCTTYSGTTQIGSAQSTTFTLQVDTSEYKPTIGTPTKTDTNQEVTVPLETAGTFIRGYSNLSLSVTFGINNSAYGSALASAKITCGNVSTTYPLSGTSGSATFTVNGISASSVKIEVTDNRGYTVTKNEALTLVNYAAVTISSVKGERVNQSGTPSETGTYIKYTIVCNVFRGSFGQANNTLRLYSYSKAASSSTWGSAVLEQTVTPTGSNANASYTFTGITTGTYSASTQHDIRFRIYDALSNRYTSSVRINEGVPVYAWGKDHFDVYGDFHIHDRSDITKYVSLSALNPVTQTVTFSGAVGGSVDWTVFKFGNFRIAASKWRCASNATISSSWNGIYTSSSISTPNFPETFSSILYSDINYVAADAAARYSADCWMTPQDGAGEYGAISGTNAGTVFLVRPDSGVTVGHPVFTQIVVGTV